MSNPHLASPFMYAGADLRTARRAAVVTHGRGGTPEDMLALVERMDVSDVAFVLPRAAGQTWYPARFIAPFEANEPYLGYALAACDAAVQAVREAGIDAERTYLIGFSQGACLMAEYVVRHPLRYAGVSLLTGGYIGPPGIEREPSGSLSGTPVFLGSSRHDPWVPLARVEETARLFDAMGAQVTLHVYDDHDHFINADAVEQTRALLS